jgi:hypothetical protein
MLALGALVAAYRPRLADLADSPGWKRYRILLTTAGDILLIGLHYVPLWVSLLPVLLSAVVVFRAHRKVPLALATGESSSRNGGKSEARDWSWLAGAGTNYRGDGPRVSLHVLNQLNKVPYPWIWTFGVFVAFFGVLLAGVPLVDRSFRPEIWRLSNFFMVVYALFAFMGEFSLRLHRVDALPVNRRALLRYMVAPGIVALLLSYGGGRLYEEVKHTPQEHIRFQYAHGKFGPAVSPAYTSLEPMGQVLEVEAPWGEKHPSTAQHPVPLTFKKVAAQDRFLSDGETSREFFAWQLSRSVEHVYGVWIAPDTLDARYIELDDEGKFYIPRQGFTVAEDFGLQTGPGGPVAPLLLTPILVLWFMLSGLYFRLLHGGRSVTWARSAWWVFMACQEPEPSRTYFGVPPGWSRKSSNPNLNPVLDPV